MKRYVRKPNREEVLQAALLALIVILFSLLHYFVIALPSWIDVSLISPLIAIRFVIGDPWTSIFLLGVAAAVTMAVPCYKSSAKRLRFLLRPALTVLVILGLSGWAIASNDSWEDQTYQRQMDETYESIHAFVDVADEAFAYNTHSQRFNNRFREEFPQLLLETMHTDGIHYYYSDYILIDYDTHRVGVVYNQYGTLKFFLYQLEPVAAHPELLQNTVSLSAPGETLVSYCPSQELQQYTDGFALIMEDGSIYAVTGLCDGKNLFLGLNSTLKPLEDFLER